MSQGDKSDKSEHVDPSPETRHTEVMGKRDEINMRNALEHIRAAATLHYMGGEFHPDHMRAIANLAIRALNAEPVPPLANPEGLYDEIVLWLQELEELEFTDDDETDEDTEPTDGVEPSERLDSDP